MAIRPVKKTVADPMQEIHNRLDEHEARITTLENIADDLSDISDTVNKIFRYLKFAGPSVISAAVAAGIVNGKLAEFFKALFAF